MGAGGALGDEVGAGQHQGLQALALRIGRLPSGQTGVALLGVAGERTGIEGVALAQGAERADECLDLAGVGTVGRDAGDEQGGEQRVLVAAGGLADDEAAASRLSAKAASASGVLAMMRQRPSRLSKTTMVALPTSHPTKRVRWAG